MKSLLRIRVFSFLVASMAAGGGLVSCSDHHEGEHHSDHHEAHNSGHDETHDKASTKAAAENHADEAEHDHERRSAEAHTHGGAELAVVLDGNDVTIELDSPLFNILGFEHAPETEAQIQVVTQVELQLERGETLFTLNDSANCAATSNDLHVALFDGEHGHDEHDDDDEVGHDDDDEVGHDDETHKDVLLTYEFTCQNPAKLANVSINLFEFFPELSEVDVIYLGPATQRQATVTRQQNQMDITP